MTPPLPTLSALPPIEAFGHLVGVPYVEGETDCWGIVVRGLRLYGVHWPEDWREVLAGDRTFAHRVPLGQAIRAGDVIEFAPPSPTAAGLVLAPGARRHVVLVVAADRHGWGAKVLHSVRGRGGSRIDTLAAVKKIMKHPMVVRPAELCVEGAA